MTLWLCLLFPLGEQRASPGEKYVELAPDHGKEQEQRIAARKLRKSIDALARVIAIELMVAARAIDLRAPLQPSRGTGAAIKTLRSKVQGPGQDRWLTPEIESSYQLVLSRSILHAVEKEIGALA